jgi:hypothetical protein
MARRPGSAMSGPTPAPFSTRSDRSLIPTGMVGLIDSLRAAARRLTTESRPKRSSMPRLVAAPMRWLLSPDRIVYWIYGWRVGGIAGVAATYAWLKVGC